MKLMLTIVRDTDCDNLVQILLDHGFRVTRVASTGGFLHKGNVTLMSAVEDDKVEAVIDLLRHTGDPGEETPHRATIFIVNMSYFEQI